MDLNELEKLNDLKQKGIITEEEFQKAKSKILNNNVSSTTEDNYISQLNTYRNSKKEEKYNFFENNPQRKVTKKDVKILLTITFCTIIFFSLFVFFNKSITSDTQNKKEVNTEIGTISKNPLLTHEIETTIEDITKIYKENYVNGNKHFLGKRIKITAPIYKIGMNNAGLLEIMIDYNKNNESAVASWPIIQLKENDSNYYINCDFKDGDSTEITNYVVGDVITIIGKLEYANNYTFGLYECKIIK